MPRLPKAVLGSVCLGAAVAGGVAVEPAPGSAASGAQVDPNPCLAPQGADLRCPDLVMRRPHGLYLDRRTKRGRSLLRAGNSIDSIGRGPAELYGTRVSARYMSAKQVIHLVHGGYIEVRTGARLQFKYAHLKRRWWKFHHAARFELWRLDSRGRRSRRVRVGPKVSYCLRDLERTRPWLARSPRHRVYPACSTSPLKRSVTLGTSIGWSDVYPPAYPEQWIDVTGLRGCFAYVHVADPLNGIYESNEDNNEAQVIVRLPWRGAGNRGCPGRSTGLPYRDAPAY